MHRFHQSRGRILFEVICAFIISASCVGAWRQTGAWALLPVAFVALLHGLIHAVDMAGRGSAGDLDPQRIGSTTDQQGDLPASQDAEVRPATTNQQLATGNSIQEAELAEPEAPRASRGRRDKAPRTRGRGRASTSKKTKVTELVLPEETLIAELAPPEEAAHPPLAPLFEPEPFVRQQRTVFGRKAG